MAIFNLGFLPRASFRGTPYDERSCKIIGDPKTVVHEFVNSSRRVVESLGPSQDMYEVEAWISTTQTDVTRDSLIRKLKKPGIGEVILTKFGPKDVVVLGWNAVDKIESLGVHVFTITYAESSDSIFPEQLTGFLGAIIDLVEKVEEIQQSVASSLYEINKVKSVIGAATQKIQDVGNQLSSIADGVAGLADPLSDFNVGINSLVSGAGSLIQSPDVLFQTVTRTLNSLGDAISDPLERFNVFSRNFGFTEGDISNSGTATISKTKEMNQKVVNDTIRALSLSKAYEAAAQIQYATFEDLQVVQSLLEEEAESLISTISGPVDGDDTANLFQAGNVTETGIDTESILGDGTTTASLLIDIRNQTNTLLSDQSLNLSRISSIVTAPIPLVSLVYGLYGDLENKGTIRDLNNISDASIVSGEVKILTIG